MTTKLAGVLKRELLIGSEPYTVTLSEEGFTLTLKGHRKGLDIRWADLVGGDAALATALNASLTANIVPRSKAAKPEPFTKVLKPEPVGKTPKRERRSKTAKAKPRGKVKPKRRRSPG